MPEKPVKNAFTRNFCQPQVFRKEVLESLRDGFQDISPGRFEEDRWQVFEIVDQVLETGNFTNVSREALRIRLTTLGLITSRLSQARML